MLVRFSLLYAFFSACQPHLRLYADIKSIAWITENKLAISYAIDASNRVATYDISSRTMVDFRDDPCSGGLVDQETSCPSLNPPQYILQHLSAW